MRGFLFVLCFKNALYSDSSIMTDPFIKMIADTEWRMDPDLVPYPDAIAFMESRVADIANASAPDCVWLLQHPPLYTAGTSAKRDDLLDPQFPVYETGRGGQYTYHGPGQRVAYVMMDLKRHYKTPDIRAYVHDLEEWVLRTLKILGVAAVRRAGRVGLWVVDPMTGQEEKIAALGIRIRRGVAYHGVAINVTPNLSHFQGIVPCGLAGYGVTSLEKLGVHVPMTRVDDALQTAFFEVFKPIPPDFVALLTKSVVS